MKPRSLVLLSGGQDSSTVLALASQHTNVVEAMAFMYGQQHSVELEAARKVAAYFSVPLKIVKVTSLEEVATSALLGGDVNEAHPLPQFKDLPASYVPGRNILFFTLGAARMTKIGATQLWTGINATDYSGYPDCRPEFVKAFETTIHRGMEFPEFEIVAPLIDKTKWQTWALAYNISDQVGDFIRNVSHTCYNGDHETKHDWGYGCGECPACWLRAKGWDEFNQWIEALRSVVGGDTYHETIRNGVQDGKAMWLS